MRSEARFESVPADAGHYESFYIKASRPGGGQSIWIRHTVHQRPGEPRTAALWVTLFDAEAGGPVATKATLPAEELSAPTGAYIQVGEALLEPGRARGRIGGDAPPASWDLTWVDGGEAFHHLPYGFLYGARLPRTKFLSPHPAARWSGTFEVGGRRIELDGWPGMIGHNWGAEHAERWVWVQGSGFEGRSAEDYFDMAVGRIKVGRFTTPWVANGQIVIQGDPYRVGGFDRIYGTELDESATECEFTFPGRGINLKGRVSAPAKDVVAWIYADPKGPEHNTLNCSISNLELKVERAHERHVHLEVEKAAAYELGTRDTDHGIPLQPFPDG